MSAFGLAGYGLNPYDLRRQRMSDGTPPTRATPELEGVQVLRAFAAMAVVVHHVIEQALPVYDYRIHDGVVLAGSSGVDLFFVISGFIMLYTSDGRFQQPGASQGFLVRRALRIAPLYWLCTFAVLGLHYSGLMYRDDAFSFSNIARSLLFLPNGNIVHGVGWTLNYEAYFYLLFAIALRFLPRGWTVVAVFAALAAFFSLSRVLPLGPTQAFLSNPIVFEFGFGLILAWLFLTGRIDGRWRTAALVIGVAGIAIASAFGPHPRTSGLDKSVRFLLWGIPVCLIAYWGLYMGPVKSAAGRLLSRLGDASYSIYLTHAFVMPFFGKAVDFELLTPLTAVPVMVGVVIFCAVLGLITYRFVELPITQWLKARLRGKPRGASAPATA